MFDEIIVHPRVNRRHPEIAVADVVSAVNNAIAVRSRENTAPGHYSGAGVDRKGRMIEFVGVDVGEGRFMVYHAMKMTDKMQRELNL